MHASTPIKNQTPFERLARSAVPDLGADEPKKPHADIAKGLFELFKHFLDRINRINRNFEEKNGKLTLEG